MKTYSFGVPGWFIWAFHLAMGLFLAYLGYQLNAGQPIDQKFALALLVIGSLSALYHAHLWWVNQRN